MKKLMLHDDLTFFLGKKNYSIGEFKLNFPKVIYCRTDFSPFIFETKCVF
jgi:hypothetical protein